MGALLATARGSEPARFLDVTNFVTEPDRPGMVSLSSRAGTGVGGKQEIRQIQIDVIRTNVMSSLLRYL